MKIKISKGKDSLVVFDYKKGATLILGDSYFRREGPILLDVSITNRCCRGCSFCYRHAKPKGRDISLDDYRLVLEEAKKCGVNQIALGGGEPTSHPHFINILKMTRDAGIVPNYSTNGDSLSDAIIEATRKYCGSIAISIYDDVNAYEDLVSKLYRECISINLHFILNKESINKYSRLLSNPPKWFSSLNSIVFLNYKPIDDMDNRLSNCESSRLKAFFDAAKGFNACSIGFDSCMSSFIAKYLDAPKELYSYCESARYSAFINESLEVFPCSFYKGSGVDLKKHSLIDIWTKNPLFLRHREFNKKKCCDCELLDVCRFGCPIYDIAICD